MRMRMVSKEKRRDKEVQRILKKEGTKKYRE
jgi:hypothetical protein